MKNCRQCPHSSCGSPDPSCDICDGCRNDPDTGWGGFTDHSIGRHFNSEEERNEYFRNYEDYESDEED